MQTNESPKLSNSSVRKRRRRRPRNKKQDKQQTQTHQDERNQEEKKSQQRQQNLSLAELTSEAHALEKQLGELQTQLKINYSNIPSKEQGRVANAIAAEQISTTEEEINYVRSSLRNTYRQIFTVDLLYVIKHHIEDKLWKYIFYARIEEIRSKLKRTKAQEDVKALQKALYHRTDTAFQFYVDLNKTIKTNYHVDTKVLGIELFKHATTVDEKIGVLLQSNYICMGDLARYQAQQASNSSKAKDCWSLAKTCYSKSIEAYRKSGKPYSQLALVSISNGNAMDVVWYYCMSLAVKYPSSVAKDNLRSFYQKIRFNSKPKDETTATGLISQFVESFLHMHQTVMFNQESNPNFSTMLSIASQLGNTVSMIISSTAEDTKSTVSLLHILRTTLTRSVAILLISIWITNDRLKDKANYHVRPVISASQIHMYTFAFNLLNSVYRSSSQALEEAKSKLEPERYTKLATYVDEALSPGLSIWCTFLYTDMTAIAQYAMTAMTDTRNREPEKKTLVKSIQSLLSHLISHPSFPDPVLNVLPITYPMSEDLLLLGISALEPFHAKVDFFKETAYEVADEKSPDARKQVRWGRIRSMFKKMADSSSFDFIQYSQAEQKYSIIDENAKRQQQNRFMKALATQRLMEQVSSLEKNVNRMSLNNNNKRTNEEPTTKKQVYTCVIDVTAFLDSLGKVKKWASQTLNANSRSQSSILEVVVPLDVIDALDQHKKGTSHMNMQARESIRYLDQKLLENNNRGDELPTTSFLRTQKVNEKLSDWSDAQAFWIGEESRSNVVDQLLSEESAEEEEASNGDDMSSDDDDDLFASRRRRRDADESDDSEEDEEEDDSSEEEEEDSDVDEEYDYEEDFAEEEEEEDIPYTLDDVPKAYRPILSCLLYYHSKQDTGYQPERLVLVTNDQDLVWWAELFGTPKTRKRLLIKSVNEWDQMVSQLDFEKVYDYTWKRQ